jgi:hypothetical protein
VETSRHGREASDHRSLLPAPGADEWRARVQGDANPAQTFFDHFDHGGTIEQFLEWYEGARREQREAAAEIRLAGSRS